MRPCPSRVSWALAAACSCSPCEPNVSLEIFTEASGTSAALRDVVVTAALRPVVVGDAGTILKREPDGVWTPRESGVTANLRASAIDRRDAHIIVVGDDGVILVSDDDGESWKPAASGVSDELVAVAIAGEHDNAVVAVGEGLALFSGDAGRSWSIGETPDTFGALQAVLGIGARFIAVGRSGAVLLSQDHGMRWTAVDAGTRTDLHSVALTLGAAIDDSDFIVAGADGTVLQMLDEQGQQWRAVDLDTTVALRDMLDTEWRLFTNGTIRFHDAEVRTQGDGSFVALDATEGWAWTVSDAGAINRLNASESFCPSIY